MTVKRWYRSKRNQYLIFVLIVVCIFYYTCIYQSSPPQDLDLTRRGSIIMYIENKLQEALKEDKGTGCEIPKLDPFNPEVTQFDKQMPSVLCWGKDWVKCYLSECRVQRHILEVTKDVECTYRDILYKTDFKYTIGDPVVVKSDGAYVLKKSDHVKIKCTGKRMSENGTIFGSTWSGLGIGYRETSKPKTPPPGREDSYNVLILGFDSTSKNGFIRRMPKSLKVLKEDLKAVILNGYNIVGDGTPAALFPILTGKTELELPECRRSIPGSGHTDQMPFVFYKLREDGYRTAYFEDSPGIGTFQYRFNGFQKQPADHYLRSFFTEADSSHSAKYCVGDTPSYKLMLNITDQLFHLPGKRFCFTFIGDITHNDFNMISTADDATAEYLREFKAQGHLKNTLLIVMGDHGPRYANVRDTYQGKLEERLPLMAIVLPEGLKADRPSAQEALQYNADVLTTPHDIHATLLDVMDLTQYWNEYKVAGADLKRGLTLLDPIVANRSCSEAGIEPHWCACLRWAALDETDPMYKRVAEAFVKHLNDITEEERSKCIPRTLTSIQWVQRQRANSGLLSFETAKDADGYVGKFGNRKVEQLRVNYQVKLTVAPGKGVYEALVTHLQKSDTFAIDTREISRTNAYGTEPSCISDTKPHLNMYCYCRDRT